MTRKLIFWRPSTREKKIKEPPAKSQFAEVAGSTSAGCVAICCCCPCAMVNCLVTSAVKLPAGLFRQSLRKRKGQKGKKTALLTVRQPEESKPQVPPAAGTAETLPDKLMLLEMPVMEEEIWGKFQTGFWREPSETGEENSP